MKGSRREKNEKNCTKTKLDYEEQRSILIFEVKLSYFLTEIARQKIRR